MLQSSEKVLNQHRSPSQIQTSKYKESLNKPNIKGRSVKKTKAFLNAQSVPVGMRMIHIGSIVPSALLLFTKPVCLSVDVFASTDLCSELFPFLSSRVKLVYKLLVPQKWGLVIELFYKVLQDRRFLKSEAWCFYFKSQLWLWYCFLYEWLLFYCWLSRYIIKISVINYIFHVFCCN